MNAPPSEPDTADSYDELPYESTPITETHPESLAVLGRWFGMQTPAPEGCRYLELGCASGGNLIPLAWRFPEARFLGVELSRRQVADGKALVARLGLQNIEIRHQDILGAAIDLGEFDYVIAHGVFSWVPSEVRARILQLCSRHLSASGVAYISYNTLPGWRMRGMVRDMLRFHTRQTREPMDKVRLAQSFLDKLERALSGLDALGAQYLRYEAQQLRHAHPSYVYHEYLETINEPLMFSDFMAQAANHGLQYLCEVDLASMFPTVLGAPAAEFVEQFDTLVEQEQCLDFLRARNFRQTLLCHEACSLQREFTLDLLDSFSLYSNLAPPKKLDLRRVKPAPFSSVDGNRFPVEQPLTKAALQLLFQVYPDAVSFHELRDHARRRVAGQGGHAHLEHTDDLRGELFNLFAHQAIGLALEPRALFHQLPDRPRATTLARAQAAAGLGHVATAWHTTLTLDPFATRLLTYLDGSRTDEDLVAKLTADLAAGSLSLADQKTPAAGKGANTGALAANCARLLALFARFGILDRPG